MIISQTSFRISFFGGGTDFPEYYAEHGGAVLFSTINKYCYLTIHRLGPFFKYRFKANYARAEAVEDPAQIQHPLIREALLYMKVREGLEIAHVADLPGRTGLGTSSSFTVGLLNVLHRMRGDQVSAEDLAREAIEIERVRVGDSGGHQDQYAAAYGGLARLDFLGKDRVAVRRLTLSGSRLRDFNDRLLLFYTGVEQSAEAIASEQTKRVAHNIPALKEMHAMVDEAERILCGGTLDEFGDLLHQTWLRKKTLSSGITNPEIDQAYDAGRRAGARGGKLLGAGGRGFLLLYADPDHHAKIRETLSGLTEVDFKFSFEGSRIIFQAAE